MSRPCGTGEAQTLVGGHQRLRELDTLHDSDEYELTVAEIDVDEEAEREINVGLNNPSMMGEYDFFLLEDMAKLDGPNKLDLAKAGFDPAEIYTLFGRK